MKNLLCNKFYSLTNREISFEDISFYRIQKIVIKRVSISKPGGFINGLEINVSKVIFYYNLLNLIKKNFKVLESINSISIDGFKYLINLDENKTSKIDLNLKKIPFNISISNGNLFLRKKNVNYNIIIEKLQFKKLSKDLADINGNIYYKGLNAKAKIDLEYSSRTELINGISKIVIKTRDNMQRLYFHDLFISKAELNAEIKIWYKFDFDKEFLSNIFFTGNFDCKNMVIKNKNKETCFENINISGDINKNFIKFNPFKIKSRNTSIDVTGNINNYLLKPDLNLEVKIKNVDPELIYLFYNKLNKEDFSLGSNSSLFLGITGNINSPLIKSYGILDFLSYKNKTFTKINYFLDYKNGNISVPKLFFNYLDGTVIINFEKNENIFSGLLSFEKINLNKYRNDIKGIADGKIEFKLNNNNPEWYELFIKINEPDYKILKYKSVIISSKLKNFKMDLNISINSKIFISGEGTINKNLMEFYKLELSEKINYLSRQEFKKYISSKLKIDLNDFSIKNFKGEITDFPLNSFLDLKQKLNLSGNFDFYMEIQKYFINSKMKLSTDLLDMNFNFATRNNKIIISAKDPKGRVDINYEINQVLKNGKGEIKISGLNEKDLNKSVQDLKFLINGKIDLDFETVEKYFDTRKEKIEIKIDKINYNNLSVENINVFGNLNQETGELIINMELFKKSKSKIELQINKTLKSYLTLTGKAFFNNIEINRSGKEFIIDFTCEILKKEYGDFINFEGLLKNAELGKINFLYNDYRNKKYRLKMNISDEIFFDINSERDNLNGNINFSVPDIKKYINFFRLNNIDFIKGNLFGKIFLSGSKTVPVFNFALNTRKLEIFEESYSGELRGLYSKRLLQIYGINLVSENKSKIILSGSINFISKSLKDINLNYFFQKLDLRVVKKILKIKNNLSGKIDFNGTASGKNKIPDTSCILKSDDVTIDKTNLKNIRFDMNYSNKTLNIKSFNLDLGASKISGNDINIINNFNEKNEELLLKGNIKYKNYIFSIFKLFGSLSMDFKIYNILKNNNSLEISGRMILDNIWINQLYLEDQEISFNYKDKIINFNDTRKSNLLLGSLNLKEKNIIDVKDIKCIKEGQLLFGGNFYLNKDKVSSEIYSKGADIDIVHKLFDSKINFSGKAFYKTRIEGDINDPLISSSVSIYDGNYGDIRFDSLNTEVKLEEGILNIKNLSLEKKEQYKISGDLKLPVLDSRKTRLIYSERPLEMSFNIVDGQNIFLKNFISKLKNSSGIFNLKIKVNGTFNNPVMNGRLSLSRGIFEFDEIFKKIKNVDVDITLEQNNLKIKNFSFDTGNEKKLIAKGSILFKDFEPYKYDLYFKLYHNVIEFKFLPIPQSVFLDKILPTIYSKGELTGNIEVRGNKEDYIISGILGLRDSKFSYPLPEKSNNQEKTGFIEFLENAKWNLLIRSEDNVWFENKLLYCNIIDTEFLFKGYGNDLLVNGKANITKGKMNYLGNEFDIKMAKYEVLNNVSYAEGILEKNVQRYDGTTKNYIPDTIEMKFDRATLENIKPKFNSKNFPETDEKTVIGQAILGIDLKDLTPKQKEIVYAREILKVIDSSLTSPFVKSIIKKTGILDTFEFQTNAFENIDEISRKALDNTSITTSDILRGSSFKFGKNINKSLYLGYGLGFSKLLSDKFSLYHEFEISYLINKNLSLRSIYNISPDKETERKIFLEYFIPFSISNNNKKK